MSDAPPVLDYGPSPSAYRRIRRIAWVIILIGGIGTAGHWFWKWYEPQWTAYRGQRAIEAVIAPSGAVLYSEDPAEVARLTGQRQYEPAHAPRTPAMPAVERVSEWYTRPDGTRTRCRSGMPPIGLRRVPGGPWRLINVNGGQYGTMPNGARRFMFPVFDVLTRVGPRPGSQTKQLWYGICYLEIAPTDRVTFWAGQLDAADESHFTFDYAINGVRGTVDGYLGVDDNVRFKIRSGPATTLPWTPRSGRQNYP